MAQLLSSERLDTKSPSIGKQLFDVITSGMYDNPLMIYREYIQNAVDSIDFACNNGLMSFKESNINICLDGERREITIEDNGSGISTGRAAYVLSSLGMSPKEGQPFRGFRGIGRLGGLAYCDELIFETRSLVLEDITQFHWDRKAFDSLSHNGEKLSLKSTVERISHVRSIRPNENDPPHFFRVRLKGVRKFHNDLLMNIKSVSQYLSQVAPVPYNQESFQFADDVHNYFSILPDYRSYNVSLNGKTIFRPYTSNFSVSKNRVDNICSIEYFSFLDNHGAPLALGWYANTQFLASLPHNVSMRGIRIRQGNIEIGDEHFFDAMYTETRFAGWTIGELHICDNKLKPNARRDSFEISENYEKFLEQAQLLGRRLSVLCRQASNVRVQRERIERDLTKIDKILNLPQIYINNAHVASARQVVEKKISDIEGTVNKYFPSDGYLPELSNLKKRCHDYFASAQIIDTIIDGRRLRKFSKKEVIKHIATIVLENYNRCESPHDLVAHIMDQFTKTGANDSNGCIK